MPKLISIGSMVFQHLLVLIDCQASVSSGLPALGNQSWEEAIKSLIR